jgi:hypothetical protein
VKNLRFTPWTRAFFILPELKRKEVQMKTIYENLCSIIMDLEVIRENLGSLGKGMEFATLRLPFDNCLIILLASKRIKEAIETLGRIAKKTKSVTTTT